MAARIEFFPVDNGDMTLITLESGRTILVDINIRSAADDEAEDTVDVAELLKARLERDSDNRLYVDAFLLSHPDADHCRGLESHFFLGNPSAWNSQEDKILIREMWSSPIVFRRKKDVEGALCSDAEAWWAEARRRVKKHRESGGATDIGDGDRILILGQDKDGKTEDLEEILVKTGSLFSSVNGYTDDGFEAILLAPHLVTDEEVKNLPGKNHSSTVLRISIGSEGLAGAGLFLTGGDAEVENWERIWAANEHEPNNLAYNILQAPHHCSWHSLSQDSWSEKKEQAELSIDARNALSQAQPDAFVVSSSKAIHDDDSDPPCIRAKREYQDILSGQGGEFLCTGEECDDDVLLLEISSTGPVLGDGGGTGAGGLLGSGKSGSPQKTDKKGGGRYA